MACNSSRRELARVRDRKFHVTQSSPYVRGEGTRDEALKQRPRGGRLGRTWQKTSYPVVEIWALARRVC